MAPELVEAAASVAVAAVAIVPATLGAIFAHRANKNSKMAVHEVRSHGGAGPEGEPTLKDYIQSGVDKMTSSEQNFLKLERQIHELSGNQLEFQEAFQAHLAHAQIMDRALAEVYLEVKTRRLIT